SPLLVVWSSVIVVKGLAPANTGASFTLVTVIEAVAVAGLNAVVLPAVVVSTFVPAVPVVWSQAQNVTQAVVRFWPSCTHRSLSVEPSNSAELALTGPTPVQVLPPSSEYCHVPVLDTRPVTVFLVVAPLPRSLLFPYTTLFRSSPLLVVWSSVIVVKGL